MDLQCPAIPKLPFELSEAEAHDWKHTAKKTVELYEEALEDR